MDERPLGEGSIANFGISLDFFFFVLDDFFMFFKKLGFLAILGPPYPGIGATFCIGREMLCLPYAGFFIQKLDTYLNWPHLHSQFSLSLKQT